MVESESGYDISVCVSLDSLPSDIGKNEARTTNQLWVNHIAIFPLSCVEGLASKIALLKRNCFASVFNKYFDLQSKGGEKSTAIIHYRDQETM